VAGCSNPRHSLGICPGAAATACSCAEKLWNAAGFGVRVTSSPRCRRTPYSGMLPGYVAAGTYFFRRCQSISAGFARLPAPADSATRRISASTGGGAMEAGLIPRFV